MLKSPEQYLSNLSFAAPEEHGPRQPLNADERAFVEKYLGLELYERLPQIDPNAKAAPPPVKTLEVQTVIVAPPAVEVTAPAKIASEPVTEPVKVAEKTQVATRVTVAPVKEKVEEKLELKTQAPVAAPLTVKVVPEVTTPAKAAKAPPVEQSAPKPAETVAGQALPGTAQVPPQTKAAAKPVETPVAVAPPQPVSLREQMKQESEIQVVSFFVAGQLFLLPVAGIQEVLRHMELVKVPQAPDFVAGVINLRGRVTPLVYLSALLTNSEPVYNEKNFIIVCGSEGLQLGLIIDRINSMHMLPQGKIIWNVESRLGDCGEYLCAIANLDDRVCGIVAPEMITQKILSS